MLSFNKKLQDIILLSEITGRYFKKCTCFL